MADTEDEKILARAQEVADVIPFVKLFQDLADDVDGWWADGVPERQIDEQIIARSRQLGFDTDEFVRGVPELRSLDAAQVNSSIKALRLDDWTIDCVKSIARTGKPLPFIYAIGDVFVSSLGDEETLVWAVATSATNPEVVAKKFVRKCKETFGDQVTKDVKPRVQHPGQMTPAEALAANDRGMSYRDIAIQNLRRTYPEIIEHPRRRRLEIKKERERVVEEIRAARALWNKRLPHPSTPD